MPTATVPTAPFNCSAAMNRHLLFLLSAFLPLLLPHTAAAQNDWGDAPDTYQTTAVAGGPSHIISPALRIGVDSDAEANGNPTPFAQGDDTAGADDEDGVLVYESVTDRIKALQIGAWSQMQVMVQRNAALFPSAFLNAWCDFNRDGDFADANERIVQNAAAEDGLNVFGFFTPATTTAGVSYTRVRLSSVPLAPVPAGMGGAGGFGEVEDYRVEFSMPSAPTNVQAYDKNGQVWITWDFNPANAAQVYEVYRASSLTVPVFNNISQGTLVARLFPDDYCGRRMVRELDEVFPGGGNVNFTIPGAGGGTVTLPDDRGLCVETVTPAFSSPILNSYNYAVVPRGFTAVSAANRTPATVGLFYSALPANTPVCHEQQTGAALGRRITFYTLWGHGSDDNADARPDFPLMGNAARNCVPHHFFTVTPDPLPVGALPMALSCHGGDSLAKEWRPGQTRWNLEGADTAEGINVSLEDHVPQLMDGRPESHTSRWLGWARTWQPFQNVSALPADGDYVVPYTLNRLNWTLNWLKNRSSLNVDADRVALRGYSAGATGALLWAHTSPEQFSHLTLHSPPLHWLHNWPDRVPLWGTDAQNLRIEGLTSASGNPLRMKDTKSLTEMLANDVSPPPTMIYAGKREQWWGIDYEADFEPDMMQEILAADDFAGALGVRFFWDQRQHGPEAWTLADAGAVQPGCPPWVAENFWIPSLIGQTRRDDVMTHHRFRRDRSYPAFYNLQDRRITHGDPGTVDYGTPPVPYQLLNDRDEFLYTGPNTDPCTPALPEMTGDRRGTWGGYFDWFTPENLLDPDAQIDAIGQWSTTVTLVKDTDAGGMAIPDIDDAPLPNLTADVAIRRARFFQPATDTVVTWMNVDTGSRRVMQSGIDTVGGRGFVRMADVTVPRLPLKARLIAATQMDFGDAPAAYPVTLAQNGARHATESLLRLGTTRNLETDGTPNATATLAAEGDDGVTGPALWRKESLVTLTINVSAACRLDAWVDWQRDGAWGGLLPVPAQDRIASALPLAAGANTLTIFVPAHAVEGGTVARFRVSLGGGLAPTGPAPEGEVEDWPLVIGASLLPTEPVLSFTSGPGDQKQISWTGNPAYCSQIESSKDLLEWRTLSIPKTEVSGTNEIVIPASILAGIDRGFFRLRRFPLVTSPVPVEAGYWSGANELSFVSSGLTRKYRLRLPANWTPQRRWPLVMLLPGHSQSIEEFSAQRSEMFPLADGMDGDGDPNDGWILCFAESLEGLTDHYWFPHDNPATYTSPFTASTQAWVDDYAFIKSLVQQFVNSGLNIDPGKIYAAGFSNGGNMCHYIASKPDHPFAAFAMIESGVMFNTGLPDPLTSSRIYARTPLPAVPRPVLINNQVDSQAWIYEGYFNNTETTPGAAPSVGALNTVARWTVANFGTGSAMWQPPTPTSPPSAFTFSTPAPTDTQTLTWQPPAGPIITPIDWVRPDTGWPAALDALPGWSLAQALRVDYTIVPIPPALRAEYPRVVVPQDIPGPPFVRMLTTEGRWSIKKWQSAPGNTTNEIVLVTIAGGAHFWPEADSPWDGSVEVLKFFEAH